MDRLRLCRHLSFYIYVSVNLMSLIYSRTSSTLRHEPLQKDLLIMSNVHPEHQQRLLLPLSEGPHVYDQLEDHRRRMVAETAVRYSKHLLLLPSSRSKT